MKADMAPYVDTIFPHVIASINSTEGVTVRLQYIV